MKTCKDCLGDMFCSKQDKKRRVDTYCADADEVCKFFKDKSRIVELPNVEIDQELFYIDRFTKTVESDIVSRLSWEKTDLGVQTGIWSENYGFSEFFSDIGKTLFLTREEAEAKLKELNDK